MVQFLLYQFFILVCVNGTFTSVFIALFFQRHLFTKEQYVIFYTMNQLFIIQMDLSVAFHCQYSCCRFDFGIGIFTFCFINQFLIYMIWYRNCSDIIQEQRFLILRLDVERNMNYQSSIITCKC